MSDLDTPLPALKVTCTSYDCERDLHCFLKKRGMPIEQIGTCRACSADLIDWTRVHRRDPRDQKFVFDSLKNEMIRHHMWNLPFDNEALAKAARKGRAGVFDAIEPRIRSAIGKAKGAYDGRQTAMQGNVIFYAQHATATCCRKCLNYWHGIPMMRALTSTELDYCVGLAAGYLEERLPDLQGPTAGFRQVSKSKMRKTR